MALKKANPEVKELVAKAASQNAQVAAQAQQEIAIALTLPLRQGLLGGDILDGIFEQLDYTDGQPTIYPLDFLAPGTEREHVAFTMPNHGYIPQKHVEGDYVMLHTYPIASSIDTNLRYVRYAGWNVVARMAEVLEAHAVIKLFQDGWHTLLAAGVDRNIVVYDSDAGAGQFTKRLISLMKTTERRNGGGNSASMNRSKLTDLYLSPEAIEDMRNWNIDQVDEVTRREIFLADDGTFNKVFGVVLHDLDELGDGQEFQLYFSNQLGGSLGPSGDVELVVGLDRSKNDSFVQPVAWEWQTFADPALHRQLRIGWYGFMETGFGVLDQRRIILGSF